MMNGSGSPAVQAQPMVATPENNQLQSFMRVLEGLQNSGQLHQYASQLAQQMPAPPPGTIPQGPMFNHNGQPSQPPQQPLGGMVGGMDMRVPMVNAPPQQPSLGSVMSPGFVPSTTSLTATSPTTNTAQKPNRMAQRRRQLEEMGGS